MPSNNTPEPLIEKDAAQLALTDDQFQPFTWDDCKAIIASGQVNKFRRWPSDLAKYMSFKAEILKSYESVEKFVLLERLHWSDPPTPHSQFPYTDPRDWQIRLNDHPYALTKDITHLVVWSAVRFPVEIEKEKRMNVYQEFVETHFGGIQEEKILWFLNWGSIQSVPGLEHFHVLLRDVDEEFVERIVAP